MGLFGCGNFGNDGSLEAMLGFLRRAHPQAELACICANPELIRQRYGLDTLPISSTHSLTDQMAGRPGRARKALGKLADIFRTIRDVRRFDVVIVPGTGILDDFGERPYGMPWDILRWCAGARLAGAKVALVSIGAGPIRQPLSRRLMTWAARLAHYRSYRDAISKTFLSHVGLETGNDPIYPDIAFSLPAPPPVERVDGERLRIGLGVMSYYGWYGFAEGSEEIYARYIEKLARFSVHLLDRGHAIRLLTGETTDAHAVEDLLQRVTAERPRTPSEQLIAEPAGSLGDLMDQMAQTDLIVATRFHNIVCALKLAKPSISLSYSKKNDVLMAQTGLGDFCQHVENFDVEALVVQFERLCAVRHDSEREIRAFGRGIQARLAEQEAFLSVMLLRGRAQSAS